MALKLSYTDDNTGYTFTDAYFKIEGMSLRNPNNGGNKVLMYSYSVYANQQSRTDMKNAIRVFTNTGEETIIQNSTNIFESLYSHLKQQPGFETAVDC